MKFSVNWLKEFVPIPWTLPELSDRLTMAGVEVEGIHPQGRGFNRVVVAQILKSDPHPNADRLSVCEVDCGDGKKQIVCGAKNYKVGDKIPLALAGAILPNGMEIKRSKLRGVESDGMMCSPKELGLADDAQGLLILPADLKIGMPLTDALGLNDTILDLEITPNRPDLLSHRGLAREIAALAGLPPPDPHKLLSQADESQLDSITVASKPFPVRVEDPTLCPRYTARVIRGVKVGPSPEWLRRRLESLGHRSISNVVDITNLVLHEIGQPLHAFDLKLLDGAEIIVRRARTGEKMARLDDETSELKDPMLVIAGKSRPVALAGVMGGKETAVSESTTDLLLESATFQTSGIRKTSKTLGVSTDSSYRFERGVDVELAAWASKRATMLILQLCGGRVEGGLVDVRSPKPSTAPIPCRFGRANSLLGVTLAPDQIRSILERIGCRIAGATPDSCNVEPPSWRPDMEREADLIEEVCRVHGITNIPGALQPFALSTTQDSATFLFARKLRALAVAQGLDEAQHYTIVSSLHSAPSDALILANPLSSEMDTLRPNLLNGLLETAARNLSHGNESVSLFEIGQTFGIADGNVTEHTSLGIILAGTRRGGASWEQGVKGHACDFHDLTGIVEGLLSELGMNTERSADASHGLASFEPGMGFALLDAVKRVVGRAGRISRALARRVKLSADTFYAELDVAALLAAQGNVTRYKPWSVYPSIRRDIALTISQDQSAKNQQHISETLKAIAKKMAAPKGILLQELRLFDIFESDKIGAGKKSLAYALIYQNPEKTLTDAEVNEVHESIKKNLKNEIACELRE